MKTCILLNCLFGSDRLLRYTCLFCSVLCHMQKCHYYHFSITPVVAYYFVQRPKRIIKCLEMSHHHHRFWAWKRLKKNRNMVIGRRTQYEPYVVDLNEPHIKKMAQHQPFMPPPCLLERRMKMFLFVVLPIHESYVWEEKRFKAARAHATMRKNFHFVCSRAYICREKCVIIIITKMAKVELCI